MRQICEASITQVSRARHAFACLALALLAVSAPPAGRADVEAQRAQFMQAWTAAGRGDHETFRRLGKGLEDYLLYPYHRYEDYRVRRARVAPEDMASFLEEAAGWAFVPALEAAWLKSLGRRGRWQALSRYAEEHPDTEVRCYLAQAKIRLGEVQGLLAEVQSLWTVGKSQPDSCDPAFEWLHDSGGITPALAWERIRLAILAGNPGFARYLGRFVPGQEQKWVDRWYDLNRAGYRQLEQARKWPDEANTRMIAAVSLQRLARRDADAAMSAYRSLDGQFAWTTDERGAILREIAFRAAVSRTRGALAHLQAVPAAYRDEQLLEWWVRTALAQQEWNTVREVIGQMPAHAQADGRWRFWQARALQELGQADQARDILETLALEASYHGFLAADRLDRPYTICPAEPDVGAEDIAAVRARADFARALELRRAGIENWAVAEWALAAQRLDTPELRAAAGLARDEGWHDRAIFALGDSGDRRYYEWRFPLLWEPLVIAAAQRQSLDASWIYGVMRSESAMAETARSSAGALGLMQVTPATARRLARKHGLAYTGSAQLRQAGHNIRFGTTFMRELLDRFDQNPVLVAGAYNAGPQAVERWLEPGAAREAAIWIEAIPYHETRDYIPRVLAFTAIYDWRMGNPVIRVSSRMPGLDSGKLGSRETTEVVCLTSG
jgi:soluble lytic murein transglycosylase